jgi:formylglycine-generating enzyme required for sulfatase activity
MSRSPLDADVFDADKTNAESTIGETSAVGCYPMGLSPYGCEDMSGNVLRLWRGCGGDVSRYKKIVFGTGGRGTSCLGMGCVANTCSRSPPGSGVAHVVDPPSHAGIQLGKYLLPRHSSESWNPCDVSA